MRRVIFLAWLVLLACVSCAFADASLYRGSNSIGSVPTIENSSGVFVSAEDVGKLLGFSASRSGDEVTLTRGNSRIRVIVKSAAAWRGMSIVPLYSEPFEQGGKIWLDSASAISLFQAAAGSGQNNRLRFNKNTGNLAQRVRPDVDVEYKKPDYTPTGTRTPQVQTVSLPKAQPQVQPQLQPKPQAQPKPQLTSTPAPAQATSDLQAKTEQPVAAVKASSTTTTPKAQPKRETFKPNGRKTEKGESYNGTITAVRWTDSEGKQKKIMAVIEANEGADPQVFIEKGVIHALFAGSTVSEEDAASPYDNVKAHLTRNDKGVELTFVPSGFTKAEKLVLNNPRRIAFDFTFPASVNITETSQPQAVTQTPQPKQPTVNVPIPTVPSTPRKRSPAVTTPPSTITIPTTPAAVRRKTVVVDPGHGGKDPGASANGVTEKNVTLAIGLELQSILAARGYRVVMTRNSDTYPTLQDRTDIANRENADLFVSIHVNALPSKKSMTGFEIYIMALPTDKDAMNLAKIENREYIEGKGMDTTNVDRRTEMLLKILGDMQQNNKISESTDFAAALYNAGAVNGLPMRRIAQAPFFVLRGAGMPAVLLETGFVTNAAEARQLATREYQQKIASAMASGIINYLR